MITYSNGYKIKDVIVADIPAVCNSNNQNRSIGFRKYPSFSSQKAVSRTSSENLQSQLVWNNFPHAYPSACSTTIKIININFLPLLLKKTRCIFPAISFAARVQCVYTHTHTHAYGAQVNDPVYTVQLGIGQAPKLSGSIPWVLSARDKDKIGWKLSTYDVSLDRSSRWSILKTTRQRTPPVSLWDNWATSNCRRDFYDVDGSFQTRHEIFTGFCWEKSETRCYGIGLEVRKDAARGADFQN